MDALKKIAESSLKTEIPQFAIGDTIKIGVKIREGDKFLSFRSVTPSRSV